MSVSLVARQEGISAGLLFNWRRLERQGALTAVPSGEEVVPASALAAARAAESPSCSACWARRRWRTRS
jgi:transposase-like protein